ncbi:response regulator [Pendulispora rubella]|uniref:Response regulator n=1 Tax=Pendulispora rubella TaxID=2741070 RepID=A0ABZ2L1D3_9BACT
MRLDNVRVLVVDDEPDSLLLMGKAFQARGAIVRAASSAAEGRRELESFSPDAIVSDIGMPDEDGYAFMRSLRAMPVAHAIPAIALTGYAYPEDAQMAIEAGFNRHMIKPVNLQALLQNVHELVNASSADDTKP